MIRKVDHIAFAVKNLEASKKGIEEGLGAKFLYQQENVEGQYVVAIYRIGESVCSLIESTSPDGFIAKHIEKFGEGVQHIGIQVDNLDETLKVWNALGWKTSAYSEYPGIERQVLLSPRHGFGVVFQVMEWLGKYKYATAEDQFEPIWGENGIIATKRAALKK
jgi:catechol 2,3-dioxygenase-like lactoylglutathione lyase family enzyme